MKKIVIFVSLLLLLGCNKIDNKKLSCAQVSQIVPGMKLTEVTKLLGDPIQQQDFDEGIALGYNSRHVKSWHVILVDRKSNEVIMVSEGLEWTDISCPKVEELKKLYGSPQVLTLTQICHKCIPPTAYSTAHLFYKQGAIAIESNHYLQRFPVGYTLEQYQAHMGYHAISWAFIP